MKVARFASGGARLWKSLTRAVVQREEESGALAQPSPQATTITELERQLVLLLGPFQKENFSNLRQYFATSRQLMKISSERRH